MKQKNKRCPAIPGEYSTCLPITSNTTQTLLTCVGLTQNNGILAVNTSIIQHLADNACYSKVDYHGMYSVLYTICYTPCVLHHTLYTTQSIHYAVHRIYKKKKIYNNIFSFYIYNYIYFKYIYNYNV